MTDVQVYDDEDKFFLYWWGGAQKEKIIMTRLMSQGGKLVPFLSKSNHLPQVLVLKYTASMVKSHIVT